MYLRNNPSLPNNVDNATVNAQKMPRAQCRSTAKRKGRSTPTGIG